MSMAANKSLKARNQAGRPQVAGSACVAAMLLLLVPLLTLEADARGGGGHGHEKFTNSQYARCDIAPWTDRAG